DAAHRPAVADAQRAAPARALGRRQVREIGLVPLLGVDDGQLRLSKAVEQPAQGPDRRLQELDVVPQRGAAAPGLAEVPLQVDHDQGHVAVGGERIRLGVDERLHACPAMWRPITPRSATAMGVSCTTLPSLITSTRSASAKISSRSALMSSTATPRF